MSKISISSIGKRLAISIGLLLAVMLPMQPALAANVLNPACEKNPNATLCKDNKVTQTPSNNSIYGPNSILASVVKLLSILIGVISIIMIIIGGLRYVTSNGDPNSTNGARNTIIYALVGLVVAVSGQALIAFVINKL